jgi:hypothetical protein
VILVHAEFEAYFEECASHALDIAEKAIGKDIYNRIVYSLGAFYGGEPGDGESTSRVPTKDIWRQKGGKGIATHRELIKGNHGVRTENLCKMLIPLGLDVRQIDSVLLPELDQFGQSRGSTAHSSLKTRRGTIVDPFVREKEVVKLIALLQSLDELFGKFVKQQHR